MDGKILIESLVKKIKLLDSANNLYVASVNSKIDLNTGDLIITGKLALYNYLGKQLTEFIYDEIDVDSKGVIFAKKNGKDIILDKNGKELRSRKR